MEQKNKPWPEFPPVLKERVIIQRGMQFYFSCVVCRELGWNKNCPGKDGKDACGVYLYKKMAEHFKKWEKINGSADTVRISGN